MTLDTTPREHPGSGGSHPLRVLIVDDEPSIRRALAIALERAGCQAIVAADGETALEVLRAQTVDVMILDLRMVGMRGDSLYHVAAAIQPHLRARSLFITGDVTDRAEALIRSCGAPYLRKPFSLADVTRVVFELAPQQRRSTSA